MRSCPARPPLLAALLALLSASPIVGPASDALAGTRARPGERKVTLFYTGAVHGTLEPCGCTSDPLGDVARFADLVRRAANEGAAVVVDAGNLSYPFGGVPGRKRPIADLRARFLGEELGRLGLVASALGETDLAGGIGALTPRRSAANVAGSGSIESGRVVDVGGVRLGVFGLAPPAAARQAGLKATDPVEAAKNEAARLRAQGATVVVALAPLERPQARQVARQAAVDFVVLGHQTGDGLPRAEEVARSDGRAFIVAAAEELQRVGRLEIVVREAGPLVDAGGAAALALRRSELERRLQDVEADLARWEKDAAARANADASFVARKRAERDELRTELGRMPPPAAWSPPATGSYFVNELVPLRRALPRDARIAASMRKLDRAVGEVNLRQAEPPPKGEPGRAVYAGGSTCVRCHKGAAAFWNRTVHAKAWKTLTDDGKHLDGDCVVCHVTGYGEVGGSAVGFTKRLEAVQCETCHGPGSVHVAEGGSETPVAVRLETPESTCKRCHNEKHSDTFDFVAYLRDVLGPGHGAEARAKLGPGPTGGELRRAAMARAKAAGLAQAKALAR